jgi:acetate---CoA ligase (ADP-forming)
MGEIIIVVVKFIIRKLYNLVFCLFYMGYMAEKEAEDFLAKEGFNVVSRSFVSKKTGIKNAISKVGFPVVMKVSGRKIVHKNKLNGVRKNIILYSQAVLEFSSLKKIKGSKGVLIQKTISGKEYLLGIKKTREFGHVLIFGSGGTDVEEKKDVAFRVGPLERDEVKKMIKDTKIGLNLLKKDGEVIEKNILRLSELSKRYPKISELDINPLIVRKGVGVVVDARIVWE